MGTDVYLVSIPDKRILYGDCDLHWVCGEANSREWERIGVALTDPQLPDKVEFEGAYLSPHNWRPERDLREMKCLPIDQSRVIDDGCRWDADMDERPLEEVKASFPWRGYLGWLEEYGGEQTYIMTDTHPIPCIWAEWEGGTTPKTGSMREGWYADALNRQEGGPGYTEVLEPGDEFTRHPKPKRNRLQSN